MSYVKGNTWGGLNYGISNAYLAIYLIRWPRIKQCAISYLSVEYPTMTLLCLESVETTA